MRAIACERLAELYDAQGNAAQHQEYLAVAAFCYGRWGSRSKVRQLALRHPGMPELQEIAGLRREETEGLEVKMNAVLRAIEAIAEERDIGRLAFRLLRLIATSTGAQRAALFRESEGELRLAAGLGMEVSTDFFVGETLDETETIPKNVARYVLRTQERLHLRQPAADPRFAGDEYFHKHKPSCAMCLPLLHRGQLSAIVYLENQMVEDAFRDEQEQLARVLGQQTAVSLATADFYKLQIEAVQARINPHFLYNTLSVIAELVFKAPNGAEAALVVLSRIYRYMLGSSSTQVVGLDEELGITKDYLGIEKHRFCARLTFHIEVVGQIDDVNVPALLLQPIVENAVRHGIARKNRPWSDRSPHQARSRLVHDQGGRRWPRLGPRPWQTRLWTAERAAAPPTALRRRILPAEQEREWIYRRRSLSGHRTANRTAWLKVQQ